MRVLAISSYANLGGAELSLATFVAHRPAGIGVEALAIGSGPLPAHLAGLGVRTAAAPALDGRPGARALGSFTRALARLLRERRPDVVWATGLKAALLAVPACRAARVPLVWHKVDLSHDARLARPLALACDGVVSVSEAAAAALGRAGRRRLLGIVGPPIRLDAGLRAAPDGERPAIGTLGRLVPYKGHDRVIEAGALLAGEVPGLRVVIGGGPAREYPDEPRRLRELAERLGIAERVEMPGFVDDVGPLLAGLSVYVSATYRDAAGYGYEALSGAVLEASWAGVPVVASRGGGAAESVVDGRTGTLVERSDARLLADAIRPYLVDPARAAAAGAAGRAFARERFAPAPAARRLFELLADAAR